MQVIDTVVLFSGHRLDEPGRSSPRFPPECETRARTAIESAMRTIVSACGPVLGIAGAADGGDILFHEVCAELGIVSEVCLALPASEYVHTSVQTSWAGRFQYLLETHPVVTLNAAAGDVWRRNNEWHIQRARERRPNRTVLLALMGERESHTPGGTLGMVRMAQEHGLEVIQLSVTEICS